MVGAGLGNSRCFGERKERKREGERGRENQTQKYKRRNLVNALQQLPSQGQSIPEQSGGCLYLMFVCFNIYEDLIIDNKNNVCGSRK